GDRKVGCITLPIGHLEYDIDKNGKSKFAKVRVPKMTTKLSQSVYQKVGFFDSLVLRFYMGSVLKMEIADGRKVLIGSDKLTHFFAQGLEIQDKDEDGKEIAALKYGISTEEEKYGMKGTGIFSYGDLAANYSGKKFWDSITDYFKCDEKTKKWTQIKDFKLKDHVTPAWDEAINPVRFKSKSIAQKFREQLKVIRKAKDAQAPIDIEACESIPEYYKDKDGKLPEDFYEKIKYFVSRECLQYILKKDIDSIDIPVTKGVGLDLHDIIKEERENEKNGVDKDSCQMSNTKNINSGITVNSIDSM
ncbi:MAG: hypothetical protein HQK51_00015, partial [Oligoflexia bacterium]|nr:hypothetical protein [Oligoflexia bacterium]